MLPVVFRRAAQTEVREAASWYEERRQGLGEEFLAEIGRVVRSVSENPKLHPAQYRGIRCALSRRFPYSIFYRIEQQRMRCTLRAPSKRVLAGS